MSDIPGTPKELVIAAIASAIAAILSFGVAALVPYLNWRGTDRWRRRRGLRIVGRSPGKTRRWSLRFNVIDAWIEFDRRRRRVNRAAAKLDKLYACPKLPSCDSGNWCEQCKSTRGLDGEYIALLKMLGDRVMTRQLAHRRRRHGERPWRHNWRGRKQEQQLEQESDLPDAAD